MRFQTSPRTEQPTPAAMPQGSDEITPEDEPRRRHRGQALVEFTIILPVFFLVVAGMFDLGFGLYSDLTIINAAREGARLGVIQPNEPAVIEQRVRAMANNLDQSRLKVTVTCQRPVGTSFTSCVDNKNWAPGEAVHVKVDYTHTAFFPLLFGTEIPLSSESKMRVE